MPSFSDHPSNQRVKILITGDSGAGKSGCVASLANAGYNVRILDYDGGLDILGRYLTPEGIARTHYVTLQDDFKAGKATAWTRGLELLKHWKTPTEDLGPVSEWTDMDVLVIDSLTFAGEAAGRAVMQRNGNKMNGKPSQADWYDIQREAQQFITWLTSDDLVNCNLVVTAHLRGIVDKATEEVKDYPMTPGVSLSRNVGRFFNSLVRIDTRMVGGKPKKYFRTIPDDKLDIKIVADVPPEVDISKLDEIFAAAKRGPVAVAA